MNPDYYAQGGYYDPAQGGYDPNQPPPQYADQYGNQYDQTQQYYPGQESQFVDQGQFAQINEDDSSYTSGMQASGAFAVNGGTFGRTVTPIKGAGGLLQGNTTQNVAGLLGDGSSRFTAVAAFKDIPFLVFFALHMIGFFVVLILFTLKNVNAAFVLVPALNALRVALAPIIIVIFIGAMLWPTVMFFATRFLTTYFIYTSIALGLLALIGLVIPTLILKNLPLAIVSLIVFVYYVAYLIVQRDSISFSAGLLKLSANLNTLFVENVYTWLGLTFMYAVYVTLWSVAGFFVYVDFFNNVNVPVTTIAIAFLILSHYLVFQATSNSMFFVSNSLGCEWFFNYPNAMTSDYAMRPFKRSLTTSFGSMALIGLTDLFFTPLYAISSLFPLNKEGQFFGGSTQAISHMTMFASSYSEASKSVGDLFRQSNFILILRSDPSSVIMTFFPLVGGGLVALLIFIIANQGTGGAAPTQIIPFVAGAFISGYTATRISAQAFLGTVAAFHACWAENKEALQKSKPTAVCVLILLL
eukprot:TRINITY_DN5759_c0_g1_i11.p1 TRINITY_DN5759_c0_g1~~TRINITY_DN5759_c0_g1_i11.p1  ORF type:complete len:605 (+),score=192.37 TRINITY_DN5759_c0_g1_i11:238-1815(+)